MALLVFFNVFWCSWALWGIDRPTPECGFIRLNTDYKTVEHDEGPGVSCGDVRGYKTIKPTSLANWPPALPNQGPCPGGTIIFISKVRMKNRSSESSKLERSCNIDSHLFNTATLLWSKRYFGQLMSSDNAGFFVNGQMRKSLIAVMAYSTVMALCGFQCLPCSKMGVRGEIGLLIIHDERASSRSISASGHK